MCFSDISSAIILFALVCIAHMVFHLFSVQNNIPFAKFSPGYGEIQRFQVPFTDLKLTSALELLSNWKWILSVSAWVTDVVAEVEGLTHSILCASAKKTVMTTSNFYFISAGKGLPELWTCETFWFGNTSEPLSEKTGKFYSVNFNLNRSIQKESFLADSAVEPLKGSSQGLKDMAQKVWCKAKEVNNRVQEPWMAPMSLSPLHAVMWNQPAAVPVPMCLCNCGNKI